MAENARKLETSFFETELGWFGFLLEDECVQRVVIGHPSKRSAREELARFTSYRKVSTGKPSQLVRQLENDLRRFAEGEEVDFGSYAVDQSHLTPFQQTVANLVRTIPAGETLSYAQVAELAGSPKAARAVGNVMANNRTPVLVPCHRVLGAGGRLGGFSAPGGTGFKQRLLKLEAHCQLVLSE